MKQPKMNLIFQAAIDVFSEKGFENAKMDDIAAKANVAKGTIYYHYKSKEDLFVHLIEQVLTLLEEEVRSTLMPNMEPAEKIEHIVAAHMRFLTENRDFCIILLREAWGSEERSQQFRHRLRNYTQLFQEIIQEGIEQEEFGKIDPAIAGWSLFGSLSIVALHSVYNNNEIGPKELEELTRISLHGLSPHVNTKS